MQITFWLLIGVVVYVYFGYLLLVVIIIKLWSAPAAKKADITPTVSLIIAAYNEEKVIARKIENVLALNYPRDKLEIIVSSDGSTDGTNEVVKSYEGSGVKLVALETNRGKSAAENGGLGVATGDIIIFSDATGMYNPDALRNLISPFCDNRIGCVTGLVKYGNIGFSAGSRGEGAYWRYEVFLRLLESSVGNLSLASGSILACRRSLIKPLDEAVGEDFVLPIKAALQGFRTVCVPEAVSRELIAETDRDLFKTKVRIVSKDLRGLFLCRAILNPFRHPLYAWGLVSHKLLRWLVPYFLIVLFASNLFLLGQPFYNLILSFQIIFYTLAMVGYLWQKRGNPPQLLGIPFSFCLVNVAALIGVAKFAMGKKSGRWKPVR